MEEKGTTLLVLNRGLAILRGVLNGFTEATMADRVAAAKVADVTLRARAAKELARRLESEETRDHRVAIAAAEERWTPLATAFAALEVEGKRLTAAHVRLSREAEAAARQQAQLRMDEAATARVEAEQRLKLAVGPERPRAQLALVRAVSEQNAALREEESAASVRGVSVESGTVSVGRPRRKWEITDLAAVPELYVSRVPKRGVITAAVNGGIESIPGIRIFDEPRVSARPRREKSLTRR